MAGQGRLDPPLPAVTPGRAARTRRQVHAGPIPTLDAHAVAEPDPERYTCADTTADADSDTHCAPVTSPDTHANAPAAARTVIG